ncbi:hypothetical protein C8Q74DRAFT_1213111 [Fomes fomentarius]|nr:hypothetical protein C8Q74DRAFT_1213111 [Fomes fomentarius]
MLATWGRESIWKQDLTRSGRGFGAMLLEVLRLQGIMTAEDRRIGPVKTAKNPDGLTILALDIHVGEGEAWAPTRVTGELQTSHYTTQVTLVETMAGRTHGYPLNVVGNLGRARHLDTLVAIFDGCRHLWSDEQARWLVRGCIDISKPVDHKSPVKREHPSSRKTFQTDSNQPPVSLDYRMASRRRLHQLHLALCPQKGESDR